jgi:toxin ParE1/3/4
MAKVVWTEPALQDLEEIAEYIALDKLSAAKKLVQKIFAATDKLEDFPKIGRKPPELRKTKHLELVVKPCRIFYREDKEIVYILFVMRSERELRNYLLEERKPN